MSGGARIVCPSADSLSREAARRIVATLQKAVERNGCCSWAISGGSTPRPLYRLLATPEFRTQVVWPSVDFFWSDERCVPPAHPDSNYGMALEEMLQHLPLPPERIHRMEGEDPDPEAAALRYEEVLRRTLGEPPLLDLVLLGLGKDGHTASIFPGSPALQETGRRALAVPAPGGGMRITLTPPAILDAREVLVLATGGEKAAIVKDLFAGTGEEERLPARMLLGCRGRLTWLLDEEANG